MKRPGNRKVMLMLAASIAVAGGLIWASINPAETSPKCMPDYMKKHGSSACVKTAQSSPTSVKVIDANKQ